MPLLPLQQSHIEACIGHLFSDLPQERNALKKHAANLKKIFKGSPIKVEEFTYSATPNELFETCKTIVDCLEKPTTYFKGIEISNQDITIGEIYVGLLAFATTELMNIAESIHLPFKNLEWDPVSITAALEEKPQFQTKYEPEKIKATPPDYPHPYFIEPDGRAYTVQLVPVQERSRLDITVNMTTHPNQNLTFSLADFPDTEVADDGSAFDTFIAHEREHALVEAEAAAQHFMANYFFSLPARKLLTHLYYFQKVNSGEIAFEWIRLINDVQLETLTSPLIIHRLETGKCNLQTALSYSAGEFLVVTHHFWNQKFQANEYNPAEFKNLTREQGLNLTIPPVTKAINAKIISVIQAKEMSPYARDVFSHGYYFDLVEKGLLDFDVIKNVTRHERDILLNPAILALLYKNKLSIQDAKKLSKEIADHLNFNPLICYLVKAGILELFNVELIVHKSGSKVTKEVVDAEKLNKFDPAKLAILIKDFISLTAANLLDDSDLNHIYKNFPGMLMLLPCDKQDEKTQLTPGLILLKDPIINKKCVSHMSYRLKNIFDNKPQNISQKYKDTFEFIVSDCQRFNINFADILEKELDACLHRKLKDPKDPGSDTVMNNLKVLGLNAVNVYGRQFAIRYFAVYEKKPYFFNKIADTYAIIDQDILKLAGSNATYLAELRCEAVKILLLKIKSSLGAVNQPDIYQKIHAAITNAEHLEAKSSAVEIDNWQTTFTNVIEMAREERNRPAPKRSFKRKITSGPLIFTIKRQQTIPEFCDGLIALSPISLPKPVAKPTP
ncbi:MAG: hypothetical protein ABI597_14160, partial [Gammaproteobacteria bacterium]